MSSIDVVGNTNLKIWRGQNGACVRGTSTLAGIWKYVLKFSWLWLWLSAFSRVFDKVQLCTPQTEVEFYILLNWGRMAYQQGLSAVEADCGNDPAR